MGDPAQLPPIEENVDSSPIFSLPVGMELTQVMRYSGAIAEYVTALRQDLTSQFPPRLFSRGNIEKMQFDTWLLAFAVVSGKSNARRQHIPALSQDAKISLILNE